MKNKKLSLSKVTVTLLSSEKMKKVSGGNKNAAKNNAETQSCEKDSCMSAANIDLACSCNNNSCNCISG